MRITDQYFWNFILGAVFVLLVFMGSIILATESRIPFTELTLLDVLLMTLATWRLVRLFVYDHGTKWLREQFFDVKKLTKGYALERPAVGIRRALADMFSCPWCFGLWAGAFVVFFYLLTPYAFYATVLLAVSAVASALQILTNLIGWQAEKAKREVEGE